MMLWFTDAFRKKGETMAVKSEERSDCFEVEIGPPMVFRCKKMIP